MRPHVLPGPGHRCLGNDPESAVPIEGFQAWVLQRVLVEIVIDVSASVTRDISSRTQSTERNASIPLDHRGRLALVAASVAADQDVLVEWVVEISIA